MNLNIETITHDDFYEVITRGKQRVEKAYEQRFITRGKGADIFAMKNFGWTDTQHIDQTISNVPQAPTVVDNSKEN